MKLFELEKYDYDELFRLIEKVTESSLDKTRNMGELMYFCHTHGISLAEFDKIMEEFASFKNSVKKFFN